MRNKKLEATLISNLRAWRKFLVNRAERFGKIVLQFVKSVLGANKATRACLGAQQ
jgi:hypothetical protein